MSKQKKLLSEIITTFKNYVELFPYDDIKSEQKKINKAFKRSLNKRELTRIILNEVVLSNDEIVALLRICFKKESEL